MTPNGARKRLASLSAQQLTELYVRVFDNADGELVLEDLRRRCFYYVPTFAASQDKNEILLNEGKRSVVLAIDTMMQPEPEQEKEGD